MEDRHLQTIAKLRGEVHPVEDVPRPRRLRRKSLSAALRELEPGMAVFIPKRNGEALRRAQARMSNVAQQVGGLSTRQDIEKEGVWVFRKQSESE
jgi:hypothetical protein